MERTRHGQPHDPNSDIYDYDEDDNRSRMAPYAFGRSARVDYSRESVPLFISDPNGDPDPEEYNNLLQPRRKGRISSRLLIATVAVSFMRNVGNGLTGSNLSLVNYQLVLDANGNLVATWANTNINDPWGNIAVIDNGTTATLFISMAGLDVPGPEVRDPQTGNPVVVRKATVLRLELSIPDGKPPSFNRWQPK